MRILRVILALLLATLAPATAFGADPQASASGDDQDSWWKQLEAIFLDRYHNSEGETETDLRGKGESGLSIVGITSDTRSYVPQSRADFVIPWHSHVESRITVTRGGVILKTANGVPGPNSLDVPGGLSALGLIEIRIEQRKDDGSYLPSLFRVMVVDPASVPALPVVGGPGDAFQQRMEQGIYWEYNRNFCYLKSSDPQCGAWRLAAYQFYLSLLPNVDAYQREAVNRSLEQLQK